MPIQPNSNSPGLPDLEQQTNKILEKINNVTKSLTEKKNNFLDTIYDHIITKPDANRANNMDDYMKCMKDNKDIIKNKIFGILVKNKILTQQSQGVTIYSVDVNPFAKIGKDGVSADKINELEEKYKGIHTKLASISGLMRSYDDANVDTSENIDTYINAKNITDGFNFYTEINKFIAEKCPHVDMTELMNAHSSPMKHQQNPEKNATNFSSDNNNNNNNNSNLDKDWNKIEEQAKELGLSSSKDIQNKETNMSYNNFLPPQNNVIPVQNNPIAAAFTAPKHIKQQPPNNQTKKGSTVNNLETTVKQKFRKKMNNAAAANNNNGEVEFAEEGAIDPTNKRIDEILEAEQLEAEQLEAEKIEMRTRVNERQAKRTAEAEQKKTRRLAKAAKVAEEAAKAAKVAEEAAKVAEEAEANGTPEVVANGANGEVNKKEGEGEVTAEEALKELQELGKIVNNLAELVGSNSEVVKEEGETISSNECIKGVDEVRTRLEVLEKKLKEEDNKEGGRRKKGRRKSKKRVRKGNRSKKR